MITSTIYPKFPFSTAIAKYIWRHKVGYFEVQEYRQVQDSHRLKPLDFRQETHKLGFGLSD
jgi:hypothetical protein